MPEVHTYGPIELVHDPTIPVCLINRLDQFADGLQESQLDDAQLATARQLLGYATSRVATATVGSEATVAPRFHYLVANPLKELCEALGLKVDYEGGPKLYNIKLDSAWTAEGRAIAIFEQESPTVAKCQFPRIVELAKQQVKLDLSMGSTGAASILSKVRMP
ncbi:hypothetical protein FRC01_006797 [Tulasnella sp. 417]|nr:hypothetical protein FRC01_006797 [Tulasnella sp. 417]